MKQRWSPVLCNYKTNTWHCSLHQLITCTAKRKHALTLIAQRVANVWWWYYFSKRCPRFFFRFWLSFTGIWWLAYSNPYSINTNLSKTIVAHVTICQSDISICTCSYIYTLYVKLVVYNNILGILRGKWSIVIKIWWWLSTVYISIVPWHSWF